MFLLGRHAILGQEPPIYLRSTTATRLPSPANVHAATVEPVPPPRITRSNSSGCDFLRTWADAFTCGARRRRTVYADERLAGTLRVLVYGASNQFFSGAGFARDQHRGFGGGHFHNAGEHVLQRRCCAHNFLK